MSSLDADFSFLLLELCQEKSGKVVLLPGKIFSSEGESVWEEWMETGYVLGSNMTKYLPKKANGKQSGVTDRNCCEGAAIESARLLPFPFFL